MFQYRESTSGFFFVRVLALAVVMATATITTIPGPFQVVTYWWPYETPNRVPLIVFYQVSLWKQKAKLSSASGRWVVSIELAIDWALGDDCLVISTSTCGWIIVVAAGVVACLTFACVVRQEARAWQLVLPRWHQPLSLISLLLWTVEQTPVDTCNEDVRAEYFSVVYLRLYIVVSCISID